MPKWAAISATGISAVLEAPQEKEIYVYAKPAGDSGIEPLEDAIKCLF
jgi:hypothetical protein